MKVRTPKLVFQLDHAHFWHPRFHPCSFTDYLLRGPPAENSSNCTYLLLYRHIQFYYFFHGTFDYSVLSWMFGEARCTKYYESYSKVKLLIGISIRLVRQLRTSQHKKRHFGIGDGALSQHEAKHRCSLYLMRPPPFFWSSLIVSYLGDRKLISIKLSLLFLEVFRWTAAVFMSHLK